MNMPHVLGSLPLLRTGEQLHRRVLLGLALLVLVWTAGMAAFHLTPPWTNVQALVWANSFEPSYDGQPPLPIWLLAVLTRVFGAQAWLSYATGIGCAAAALYLMWRWACGLMHPARATLALLLSTLIAYHAFRAVLYQHGTVQLLPVAGFWVCLWHCTRSTPQPRWRSWAWLGLWAALALLCGDGALLPLAAALCWLLSQGLWREPRVQGGVLLAAAVCLLLLSPYLYGALLRPAPLPGAAPGPLVGSGASGFELSELALKSVARLLPMLLALGLLRWQARHEAVPELAPGSRSARLFLGGISVLPLLLAGGLVLLNQPLPASWLASLFLPLPFWLMARSRHLQPERWTAKRWRQCVVGVLLAQLMLVAVQGWAGGVAGQRLGHACRGNLPAAAVAERLREVWVQQVGPRPLPVLAAERWFGGALALQLSARLQVDAQPALSPWLAADALEREGGMVLALDTPGFGGSRASIEERLRRCARQGRITLPWTLRADGPQVIVRWGLVPPSP